MLSLKPGVRILGLTPQACLIIMIVERIYSKHEVDCVITSGTDGKHGTGSDHYSGNAVDFRTHNLREKGVDPWRVAEEVKTSLGAEFDVLLESSGSSNEHLHIEWDPKTR